MKVDRGVEAAERSGSGSGSLQEDVASWKYGSAEAPRP